MYLFLSIYSDTNKLYLILKSNGHLNFSKKMFMMQFNLKLTIIVEKTNVHKNHMTL